MIPGRGFRPAGLARPFGLGDGVLLRLGMRIVPTGFQGRSTALPGGKGPAAVPRCCSVTALPLTYFSCPTTNRVQLYFRDLSARV